MPPAKRYGGTPDIDSMNHFLCNSSQGNSFEQKIFSSSKINAGFSGSSKRTRSST